MLRYNHDIWDVYLLNGLVQKLNASSTSPPLTSRLRNRLSRTMKKMKCVVMQVLLESADPLPVRHDADVCWQGR